MLRRIGTSLLVCLGLAAHSGYADTLHIKNFRELLMSLSAVTEVPTTSASVQLVYSGTASRLPINGTVDEFTSPMLLAVTELAGAFCAEAATRDLALEPGLRKMFKKIDMGAGSGQFRDAGKLRIIGEELAGQFWQRPMQDDEFALLTSLTNTANVSDVSQGARMLCVYFGTSIDFLLN